MDTIRSKTLSLATAPNQDPVKNAIKTGHPDEVIKYASGIYGEPDGEMDLEVKDKILSSAKAKKLANWAPPDISLKDIRKAIGSGLSDEQLLLRLLNPDGEVKAKLRTLYGGDL